MTGSIWAKYYVTCGQCECSELLTNAGQRAAELRAKEKGYRYCGDDGWVCGDCLGEAESPPAGHDFHR